MALLALIWGSSFILIKRGLFTNEGLPLFSGVQVGALRIVVAAVFMLPFVWKKFTLLKNANFIPILVVGLCGNAIPAFLFATAQTKIPSALAGMINSMVPLFSLIIAFFIFKVKVKSWQVAGLFLGLIASAGLLLASGSNFGGSFEIGYAFLVVLATICYAISLNTIKQYLQNVSAIAITGLALILVSPIGIAVLLATDFVGTVSDTPGSLSGFAAVSTLAIFGTALALMLFNKLVQDTNTIFASSVTYLIPLVAIVWGVMDGEMLNLLQIICALCMLGGIILINRK